MRTKTRDRFPLDKYADLSKPINVGYEIKNNALSIYFKNFKKEVNCCDRNRIGLQNIKEIIQDHDGHSIIKDEPDSFFILIPTVRKVKN